ncbi:MAG: PAS domain S-box protein, partial [Acidobacteriota bacterium]
MGGRRKDRVLSGGRPRGSIGSACDISERKRAEEALRRLSRFYRTLLRANEVLLRAGSEEECLAGVCRVLAAEGGFLLAWVGAGGENGSPLAVLASAGEAMQYLQGLIVRRDDLPEGRGPTGRALREGRPVVVNDWEACPSVQPWRRRAQEAGFLSSGAFPIWRGGRPWGALNLYASSRHAFGEEEVTLCRHLADNLGQALEAMDGRRRLLETERQLQESLQTVRTLSESAPSAILACRGEDFVYANPETCRLTGYSLEELAGKSVLSLVHPDDLPLVREWLAARREGREVPGRYEFRLTTREGHTRWVDFTAAAGELQGEKAVLCTAYDITGRKEAEARLVEAQKLETIGMIAGSLAHEVRNPLFALQTLVAGLERRLQDREDLAEFFGHMKEQVNRLNGLMADLLQLGRPIAKEAFGEVDLGEVVAGALGNLSARYQGPRGRWRW